MPIIIDKHWAKFDVTKEDMGRMLNMVATAMEAVPLYSDTGIEEDSRAKHATEYCRRVGKLLKLADRIMVLLDSWPRFEARVGHGFVEDGFGMCQRCGREEINVDALSTLCETCFDKVRMEYNE